MNFALPKVGVAKLYLRECHFDQEIWSPVGRANVDQATVDQAN